MRNPLEDPQPFDVIQARQIQLHVHFRKPDQVYFGRWRNEEPLNLQRCTVDRWREECAANHAEVIQRAEEVAEVVL